jgi:hypothetical protein
MMIRRQLLGLVGAFTLAALTAGLPFGHEVRADSGKTPSCCGDSCCCCKEKCCCSKDTPKPGEKKASRECCGESCTCDACC